MQSPPPSKRIVLTQHMFGLGGIDRVGCLLASGFAQANFEVDLVVFCEGGPAEDALLPIIDDRVRISYLGRRSKRRIVDLIKLTPKWVRWLRQHKPDVVLSTCNNMNWVSALGVKLSALADTRLILKTTNPIIRKRDKGVSGRLRKFFYRKAFEFADRVLALSDAETRLLRLQFPSAAGHIKTVINPYVTPEMLNVAATQTTDDARKIILGVGRFEPQKRLDLLIKGFAALNNPSVRLVILGDGPDRETCEQLVRDLHIENQVHMPGFVDDVPVWLNSATVFVLTSVYEGLPAVVLEALACNCPVLSTDCFPAARELLSHAENCALIVDENPAALASLLREHVDLDRPKGLKTIAERYTVENGIASHIQHIAHLIQ